MKIPTKTFNQHWIFSTNVFNSQTSEHTHPYAGKWLIFVSPDRVDDIWAKINEATKKGALGIHAKCSTMAKTPSSNNEKMVICIYTYDYRDKDDVFRVRNELRKMGFDYKIPYKKNQTTREGKYAIDGHKTSLHYI